jgi:small multidrug resistance pump
MSAWLYLATAILFEVAGTLSMRLSEGFTKVVPSTLVFIFYTVSFIAMAFAIKRIDISVSYAVWSATGTALIATIGIVYFNEPLTALKIFSLTLIILGVVGLNLGTTEH